ncbi:hypothetical protein J4E80_001120 [Alternaria sp. BMP 0032]|nr:hypothetical protein J4E80_001120 [Alternaria sp. BMP 0032]
MSDVQCSNFIEFYTDGSAIKDGKKTAAGAGVWFGPNDPRNSSSGVGDGRQTNQRAELCALWDGLAKVKWNENVRIYSDSQYAMCQVAFRHSRKLRENWKRPEENVIPNSDIIEPIVKILQRRSEAGGITEFQWVKGHSGVVGNEKADEYAGNASKSEFKRIHGYPYPENADKKPRKRRLEDISISEEWAKPPPGYRFITLPNGEEDIERIDDGRSKTTEAAKPDDENPKPTEAEKPDDETLKRKEARKQARKMKQKQKKKARQSKQDKSQKGKRPPARRQRPMNAEQRRALRRARIEEAEMYPKPRLEQQAVKMGVAPPVPGIRVPPDVEAVVRDIKRIRFGQDQVQVFYHDSVIRVPEEPEDQPEEREHQLEEHEHQTEECEHQTEEREHQTEASSVP